MSLAFFFHALLSLTLFFLTRLSLILFFQTCLCHEHFSSTFACHWHSSSIFVCLWHCSSSLDCHESLTPFFHTRLSMTPFFHIRLSVTPFFHTRLWLTPFFHTRLSMTPFFHTRLSLHDTFHTRLSVTPLFHTFVSDTLLPHLSSLTPFFHTRLSLTPFFHIRLSMTLLKSSALVRHWHSLSFDAHRFHWHAFSPLLMTVTYYTVICHACMSRTSRFFSRSVTGGLSLLTRFLWHGGSVTIATEGQFHKTWCSSWPPKTFITVLLCLRSSRSKYNASTINHTCLLFFYTSTWNVDFYRRIACMVHNGDWETILNEVTDFNGGGRVWF